MAPPAANMVVPIDTGTEPPPPTTTTDSVVAMETETTRLQNEVYGPAPTSSSALMSRILPVAGGDVKPMMLFDGCNLEASECRQQCLDTRYTFRAHADAFWHADDDYWQYVLTGRSYLTGTSIQSMRNALYGMRTMRDQYRSLDCQYWLTH